MLSSIDTKYEQWAPAFASVVVDASDPLSIENFAVSLKKMGPQTALSLAKTVFLSDHRSVLDKVVVPCNIIQTRNDVVVPFTVVEYMQSAIKAGGGCEVDVIDTEGHFPHLTAHLQFVQVLDRILGC